MPTTVHRIEDRSTGILPMTVDDDDEVISQLVNLPRVEVRQYLANGLAVRFSYNRLID